jgi:hypothetical protein
MGGFKLQISDKQNGVNFNVRYEKLDRAERPEVIAKAPSGAIVKERTIYQGQALLPGSTQKQWVDDQGAVFSKAELTFWFGDQQVNEIQQTKVFDVVGFQPLSNYTDNYIIDKYYEIYPDDNGLKKDIDKERARQANQFQMRKLWDYLNQNQVVARGEFCTSSKGFVASDGYLRAIKINGNKWGIEIGVFKEEKVFQHLQEGVPHEAVMPQVSVGVKLKRV